jgi:hypothetical protein
MPEGRCGDWVEENRNEMKFGWSEVQVQVRDEAEASDRDWPGQAWGRFTVATSMATSALSECEYQPVLINY